MGTKSRRPPSTKQIFPLNTKQTLRYPHQTAARNRKHTNHTSNEKLLNTKILIIVSKRQKVSKRGVSIFSVCREVSKINVVFSNYMYIFFNTK